MEDIRVKEVRLCLVYLMGLVRSGDKITQAMELNAREALGKLREIDKDLQK